MDSRAKFVPDKAKPSEHNGYMVKGFNAVWRKFRREGIKFSIKG